MKHFKTLTIVIASIKAAFSWLFKRFLPFGCGHWGMWFDSVIFNHRTLYLTKEEKRRRAQCYKCILANLAKVSLACHECRNPIVPGDLVYYKPFYAAAVFPDNKNNPVFICDTCRGDEFLAGRWSDHGLVGADQHPSAIDPPPSTAGRS